MKEGTLIRRFLLHLFFIILYLIYQVKKGLSSSSDVWRIPSEIRNVWPQVEIPVWAGLIGASLEFSEPVNASTNKLSFNSKRSKQSVQTLLQSAKNDFLSRQSMLICLFCLETKNFIDLFSSCIFRLKQPELLFLYVLDRNHAREIYFRGRAFPFFLFYSFFSSASCISEI